MNIDQPVIYIVMAVLGLAALGTGPLVLLVSGRTRVVLSRVSGGLLLLVSQGGVVLGLQRTYANMWSEAGAFFLASLALFIVGWLFVALGAKGI